MKPTQLGKLLQAPAQPASPENRAYEAKYWQHVRECNAFAEHHCTSDELEAYALRRLAFFTRGAELSERYRFLVHCFAQYFAADPSCPLPLHKGIILAGGVGTGKTTLFRAFDLTHRYHDKDFLLTENNVSPFIIVSCRGIARNYADKKEGGIESLKPYYAKNRMFDDFGAENPSSHYGYRLDVMNEIIQERYDRQGKTYFTTNLTYEQINRTYDVRAASRLDEMCSWVDIGECIDHRRPANK